MSKLIPQPQEPEEDSFLGFYKILAEDRNNMSYWFPRIHPTGCDALRIPKTAIVSVIPEITELFFMEKQGMTQTEMAEAIYEWVKTTFQPNAKALIGDGFWFIKNGGFSNKFEFDNCRILSSNILKMTDQIININYQALCFDAGGSSEMVAREFIQPPKNTPTIYSGMPLRCEVRVFYDFDKQKVLYAENYWDWDHCHQAIAMDPTDKIVYEHEYPRILERYNAIYPLVIDLINERMPLAKDMHGIWSVDVMESSDYEFYLIDMAIGQRSAYWDPVKAGVSNG